MSSPLRPQGNLNRIRASFLCPTFPLLNLTTDFLGKRGLSLAFEGNFTDFLDTMVGGVPSPVPYVKATMTAYIVKSMSPALAWQQQIQNTTLIGECTVIPDATPFQNYDIYNCSIMSNLEQSYAGDQAEYPVSVVGYYPVNGFLFDS